MNESWEATVKRIAMYALALWMAILTVYAQPEQVFVPDLRQAFPFLGERVVEPPDDVHLDALDAAAYGIPASGEVPQPAYLLMEGAPTQTPVYLIDSGKPGPVVYVLAGTHGDERAGWYAATMLKGMRISAGKLYVLPQANKPGSEAARRTVQGSLDLNRAYPGHPQGDAAMQLAHAIVRDIEKAQPVVVLDLHEAAVFARGRDFLGNKVIYTTLDGIEDLFFALLTAFEEGALGAVPFGFVSPGVADSLNAVLPEVAGIPVLTVETFRGYPLSRRVQDQVDIVLACLRFYGMMEE